MDAGSFNVSKQPFVCVRAARLLFPAFLLALAPAAPAWCAHADAPETEVVVTASRRQQPKRTASAPVTVVTAEEIEASGARNAAEALRSAVGVDVRRGGALGAVASPSLRGSAAGQVLVLVDGRRVNNPQMGEADLTDLPAGNIERIEVLRGGASALYGSDAIGGVINVITRTPGRVRETKLTQSYGAFDTYRLSGHVSAPVGRWRCLVSGERVASDNDFTYFDPVRGSEASRRNAEYSAWDLTAKAVGTLGEGRRLNLSAEVGYGDKHLPGSLSYPTPQARQTDRRGLFDLAYETPLGDAADLTARLYRVQHRMHYRDPGSYPAPTNALHRTAVSAAEVLTHVRLSGMHQLTLGGEVREQRARSTSVGRRTQRVGALYVQDEARRGRLQLVPAARVDLIEGFAGEVSPKLGLVYRVDDALSARANLGRAFRAPSMNDLYWPEDPFAKGNPALRPERAYTADAGLTWLPAPDVEVEATAFFHRVKELILWQPGVLAPGKWSPVNVGTARVTGVEVSGSWQVSPRFSTRAHLTWQDARDRSGSPNTHGKRLLLRPEVLGGVQGTYAVGEARAQVEVRFTGRRPADPSNYHYLGSAVVADARVLVPLGRRVTATLAVENAFDKRYELQPGYPLPGRAFTLTLSERW
ncbi:MAG: TonB-dependent receptor [Armatimonadota bacterium]|nr:TonB-dependent receptor [Armatimonadota bacterium]